MIEAAYRALIKQYHPDVNLELGATETTIQIKEAYEYLREEENLRQHRLKFSNRQPRLTETIAVPGLAMDALLLLLFNKEWEGPMSSGLIRTSLQNVGFLPSQISYGLEEGKRKELLHHESNYNESGYALTDRGRDYLFEHRERLEQCHVPEYDPPRQAVAEEYNPFADE